MRADEVVKGDRLWGRTVEVSVPSIHPDLRRLAFVEMEFSAIVPCDAELVVVRPPKMMMVELPEETVKWYAAREWADNENRTSQIIGDACRKALADREGQT